MTEREALKLALEALEMWCPMTATYLNTRDKAITAIREALAQPEQEPAGQLCEEVYGRGQIMWFNNPPMDGSYVYTTSPQRKPLTDQQIVDLCDGTLTTWEQVRIARAIEAAHGIKEKNT